MFVSSNLAFQSLSHDSLLKASCGVSVTELCLTAIFLSENDFNIGGRTFLRTNFVMSKFAYLKTSSEVNYPTQKNKWKMVFKHFYCSEKFKFSGVKG